MTNIKQWLVLGAVAGAMALTGCQDRDRSSDTMAPREGTGGSGSMNSRDTMQTAPQTAPTTGSSSDSMNTGSTTGSTMDEGIGGSGKDDAGTGHVITPGTGGSGSMMDDSTGGSGSTGSGSMNEPMHDSTGGSGSTGTPGNDMDSSGTNNSTGTGTMGGSGNETTR